MSRKPRPVHRTVGVFKEPAMLPDGYPAPPPRDHRGRQSKMTPELRKKLVANITTGAPIEHCAGAVGISRSVVYDWLARGQEDETLGKETEFAALFRDIARARGAWWVAGYGKVSLGAEGWKGRAWLMERLDRVTLAPPTLRQEVRADPDAGGDFDASKLSDEELLQLRALVAKGKAEAE